VHVREDSYLATAELLETVLNKIGDGSTMTGVELKNALDKVLGGPVSYGSIPELQGDRPAVALDREVSYSFPGFPHFESAQFSSDEASGVVVVRVCCGTDPRDGVCLALGFPTVKAGSGGGSGIF